MQFLKITILTLLIVSCAPIRINYDYDTATNFTNYKTYNYYSEMKTGLSELDTKRFLDALDSSLVAKGFTLSDTPDFFIDIKSSEYREPQQQNVGFGIGGGGGTMGGGVSIGLPIGQANINRRITIDFVDDSKKQLFWQAVSDYSFKPNAKPEQREEKFNAVAEKVLAQYPPKQ